MIQKWHLENIKMDVHVTTDNNTIVTATPRFAERCIGSSLNALVSLMEERYPTTIEEEC